MTMDNNNGGSYLSTEVVNPNDLGAVEEILKLEPLFINEVKYDREKISEYLSNPKNLSMLLRKHGEVIGFVLSQPHDDVVDELKFNDPKMIKDPARYYIDKIAVIPEERRGLSFLQLLYDLFEELNKRDVFRFSAHVLASNGLHKILYRIFKPYLTSEYRMVNLYGDEPYMYLEIKMP